MGVLGRFVERADLRRDHPDAQAAGARAAGALFDRVAVPVAGVLTRGAFLRHWRMMAIDGFELDVPDTPANAAAFGYPVGAREHPAFPNVRVVPLNVSDDESFADSPLVVPGGCRGPLSGAPPGLCSAWRMTCPSGHDRSQSAPVSFARNISEPPQIPQSLAVISGQIARHIDDPISGSCAACATIRFVFGSCGYQRCPQTAHVLSAISGPSSKFSAA